MRRSMRKVLSNQNLKKAQTIIQYPLKGIEVVGEASDVLQSSHGRDKICQMIQYIADFYFQCHKHSQIGLIKLLFLERQIESVIIAGKIRDSMKNGRKIFKFLKYLEQIKKFKKIYDSRDKQHFSINIAEIINVFCKMCSQFCDNILWGINIGVLSDLVAEETPKKSKNIKDTFTLIGAILKIFLINVKFYSTRKKEYKILKQIRQLNQYQASLRSTELFNQYIEQRKKKRAKLFKLIITTVRILMLTKRLKIQPFKQFMDGVLYSLCGLFITLTALCQEIYGNFKQRKIDKEQKNRQINDDNSMSNYQQQRNNYNNNYQNNNSSDEDSNNNIFSANNLNAQGVRNVQIKNINRTISANQQLNEMQYYQ